MTPASPKRVILAAGGTGGHMFPAQALARELLARDLGVTLITDRRGGGFGPDLPQVDTCFISAGGLAGRGPMQKLRGALRLGLGVVQAWQRIRALDAEVVVGFGGYASVPSVLAAVRLGRHIVLHEQNAVLGRANRLLARRAHAIATSFDTVTGIAMADRDKVQVTGNPVRPAIAELGRRPYVVPDGRGDVGLLVVGGSQGAAAFDEIVPDAIVRLPQGLRERLVVCQQIRGQNLDEVAAKYRAHGVRHDLRPFFDDMPERLAAAHLVIGRAGASTVAELAAAGRPGLLIPYPFAIDDHQSANARSVGEAGSGWLMPQAALTAEHLAERLESLLSDPASLARASRCALANARADAARSLADLACGIGQAGKARKSQGVAA